MMKKKFYTTPSVLVVDIEVEKAFLVLSNQEGDKTREMEEDDEFGAGSYRSNIWN